MESEMAKFRGTLTLLSSEKGGRSTPISTGFRTEIRFRNETRMAIFELEEADTLDPGESASAACSVLLHGREEVNWLSANRSIDVLTGPEQIGEFTINIDASRD